LKRCAQDVPLLVIGSAGLHPKSAINVVSYPAVSGTIVISTRRLA
jgi:hypothetical protein